MAENQSIEKILSKTLRIVGTVLYIGWFIFLLLGTVLLVAMMAKSVETINEPYTSDIYVEFHTEIYIGILGFSFSVLHLETALVLLRKYSKALGILHIVLFAICSVATCILLMLEFTNR